MSFAGSLQEVEASSLRVRIAGDDLAAAVRGINRGAGHGERIPEHVVFHVEVDATRVWPVSALYAHNAIPGAEDERKQGQGRGKPEGPTTATIVAEKLQGDGPGLFSKQ
jgi:hypothetical protein